MAAMDVARHDKRIDLANAVEFELGISAADERLEAECLVAKCWIEFAVAHEYEALLLHRVEATAPVNQDEIVFADVQRAAFTPTIFANEDDRLAQPMLADIGAERRELAPRPPRGVSPRPARVAPRPR